LCFSATAGATIVELDLLSLGCPTELNIDSTYWQTNFDLGVNFTEITNVYMDWSGSITAGLAIDSYHQYEPFPLQVGLLAGLGIPFNWRHTDIWGGETTYPAPEPFDCLSEFVYGSMSWSELFDGQGSIGIEYQEVIMADLGGRYVEHGSVTLDKAILRVEGTVPEPATILFLGAGIISLFVKKHIR
jgi:hypothetical protein